MSSRCMCCMRLVSCGGVRDASDFCMKLPFLCAFRFQTRARTARTAARQKRKRGLHRSRYSHTSASGAPSPAVMAVPLAIAPCATYFLRADEMKAVQPFVAHHLRLFGVEMAMKMSSRDAAAGRFLLTQMDNLEAEKKEVKFTTPPTARKAFTVAPPPAPPPPKVEAAVDVSDEASAAKDAKKKDGEDATEEGKKEVAEKADDKSDSGDKKPEERAAGDLSNLSLAGGAGEASVAAAAPPPKPRVEYRQVAQTPTEALKSFALDLYERARGADDPKAFPSPSTSWGVVEAPKIARGLHACAVTLDAIKQFGALPADLLPFQTAAHKRSQQLGQQIHNAFKTEAPVPPLWAPVDVNAPFAAYKPPAPQPTAQQMLAMFPSAGTAPVQRR